MNSVRKNNDDKYRSGYLYYFQAKFNGHVYYKFGVTKHPSLKKRFSYNGSKDYKYINKVYIFKFFDNAFDIEQKIHSFLRKQKANYARYDAKAPFFNNGHSEFYPYDIFQVEENLTELDLIEGDIMATTWERAKLSPSDKLTHNVSSTGLLSRLWNAYLSHSEAKRIKEKRKNILSKDADYFINRSFFEKTCEKLKEQPRIQDLSHNDGDYFIDPLDRKTWWEIIISWADQNSIPESQLPRSQSKLLDLESLDVSLWELTNPLITCETQLANYIPKEIGKLRNLKRLSISMPDLPAIPVQLGCLKQLTHLSIDAGNYQYIPEEIYELNNLQSLSISCGKIKNISTKISNLKNLIVLDLRDNEIECIPNEIGELVKLEELWLGGSGCLLTNSFTALPRTISNLVNLKTLCVSDGDRKKLPLNNLPSEVFKLTKLEVLLTSQLLDSHVNKIKKLKNLKNLCGVVEDEKVAYKLLSKVESGAIGVQSTRNEITKINSKISKNYDEYRMLGVF